STPAHRRPNAADRPMRKMPYPFSTQAWAGQALLGYCSEMSRARPAASRGRASLLLAAGGAVGLVWVGCRNSGHSSSLSLQLNPKASCSGVSVVCTRKLHVVMTASSLPGGRIYDLAFSIPGTASMGDL